MSNQWPSACSVNNLDNMGRPGERGEGVPPPRKTSNRGMIACSVKGTLIKEVLSEGGFVNLAPGMFTSMVFPVGYN